MRGLFIFVLCATVVYGRPPTAYKAYQKPVGNIQVPVAKPVLGDDEDHHHHQQQEVQPVGIIHQESAVNPDGSFHNVWESENGIKVSEEGTVTHLEKGTPSLTVAGQVSYPDSDGNPIVLHYTADENGFHPQGDHLPTPPPIPLPIARALEYIAAHPYVEDEQNVKHASGQYFGAPIVEDA